MRRDVSKAGFISGQKRCIPDRTLLNSETPKERNLFDSEFTFHKSLLHRAWPTLENELTDPNLYYTNNKPACFQSLLTSTSVTSDKNIPNKGHFLLYKEQERFQKVFNPSHPSSQQYHISHLGKHSKPQFRKKQKQLNITGSWKHYILTAMCVHTHICTQVLLHAFLSLNFFDQFCLQKSEKSPGN